MTTIAIEKARYGTKSSMSELAYTFKEVKLMPADHDFERVQLGDHAHSFTHGEVQCVHIQKDDIDNLGGIIWRARGGNEFYSDFEGNSPDLLKEINVYWVEPLIVQEVRR